MLYTNKELHTNQEEKIINVYAPINVASKYIKQQTAKMGEMDISKIIFGDFSTTLLE